MSHRSALLPAGSLIVGAELALRSPSASPLLAVVLAAVGLAAGGRGALGRVSLPVLTLATGLLSVWLRPEPVGRWLENRPGEWAVTVEGVASRWRRDAFGWSTRLSARKLVFASRAQSVRGRIRLSISGVEAPPARRLRVRGLLSAARVFRNGVRVPPGQPRLRVKSARLIESGLRRGRSFVGLSRLVAESHIDDAGDAVGLARALTTGDPSGLSVRLQAGFRRAGLAHLLALSGLHVGILTAAGLRIGGLLPSAWRWAPATLGVSALLALAGLRPALLRAVSMGLLAGVALASGARPSGRRALTLVAAGMVALEPDLLRELAFTLTVVATGAILWVGSVSTGGRPIVTGFRASLAAQLSTLPWTLPSFSLVSPMAVLHNLWAVPWTAVALSAAALWTAAGLAGEPVQGPLRGLLELVVAPFEALAALPAGPWHSVPLFVSAGVTVVVVLVGLVLLARLRWGLVGVGLLFAALALECASPKSEVLPELVMLDVGQGDALVIRDRAEAVLLDGGGWARGDFGGRVLVPALAQLGIRRLKALGMTHPDRDHCGGLVDVAAYLRAPSLWAAPGWSPTACFGDLLGLPSVGWRPLWAGARLTVGRWRLTVLHPMPGDRLGGNDRSLVLRAEAHGFSALLTGDLEQAGERRLLAAVPRHLLHADLLKVGHHGSRTSTGEALLDAVAPRLAWISAGRDNRYGHPSREVLDRLHRRGVRVLRTDRDGQIRLRVGRLGSLHLELPESP